MVNRLGDRVYILKEGKIVREINNQTEIANTQALEEYL